MVIAEISCQDLEEGEEERRELVSDLDLSKCRRS
jgi:hypothetical protein